MSSVELEVIHKDFGTAEDDHRKDVLRWGFKPVDSSSDSTFLWAENGRLWANTLTVQVAQPSVPITPLLKNPSLTAADTQFYARASLPLEAVTYVMPRHRVVVGVHKQASSSYYLAQVKFDDGSVFELQVDTGSTISWVCGFPRGTYRARFDLTRTPGMASSHFEVAYDDDTHVKGILCNARATFGNGAFCLDPWTFCVATSANDKMRWASANDGVLALSCNRPPSGSGKTQFHPGVEAETFVEKLIRAGLIGSFTFCVNLGRRREPGIITFGELPDLGSEYSFQDAVAGRWALPSKRIGILDSNGHESEHVYSVSENKTNAALFDSRTAIIYIDNDAADWLYGALLGSEDYKTLDGTRYIEPDAVGRLRDPGITFYFGNLRFTLPATILQGKYSPAFKAYMGTIQGKSGGGTDDDEHWSFDIMGNEFFRHVCIAFDTDPTQAKIAIVVNQSQDIYED